MIGAQHKLMLDDELVIDLFAGGNSVSSAPMRAIVAANYVIAESSTRRAA